MEVRLLVCVGVTPGGQEDSENQGVTRLLESRGQNVAVWSLLSKCCKRILPQKSHIKKKFQVQRIFECHRGEKSLYSWMTVKITGPALYNNTETCLGSNNREAAF